MSLRFSCGLVIALGVLGAFAPRAPAIANAQRGGNPQCPPPKYINPVPPPDKLAAFWGTRKRYKLVIGAGKYAQAPAYDRPFVAPTAKLVDAALSNAGYTQSLSPLGLLTDANATKKNIEDAFQRLSALPEDALVLIYYIGHGIPSSTNDDIWLSVADRPVGPLEGLPVKQLIVQSLKLVDPAFRKIPRVIFILETCYSGAAAPFSGMLPLPPGTDTKRLAFLSATGPQEQSLPLKSQSLSAFGYFFARAFDTDWACADRTPDGAMTIYELATYLQEQLRAAQKSGEITGPMTPDSQDRSLYSILTYDAGRVADLKGYRDDIVNIDVAAQPDVEAEIAFAGQPARTCVAGKECRVTTDSIETASIRFVHTSFGTAEVTGQGLQKLLTSETHLLTVTRARGGAAAGAGGGGGGRGGGGRGAGGGVQFGTIRVER